MSKKRSINKRFKKGRITVLESLASRLYHTVYSHHAVTYWYPVHAEYNEIERNSAGSPLVIFA